MKNKVFCKKSQTKTLYFYPFGVSVTMCWYSQIPFCRNTISEQRKVVEAIEEEIQMMAKLNHPNIVRILGATRQTCHFFMFVEWMPGMHGALVFHPTNVQRIALVDRLKPIYFGYLIIRIAGNRK